MGNANNGHWIKRDIQNGEIKSKNINGNIKSERQAKKRQQSIK